MIDFADVIFNGLWILGLSVLLATWSYARYTAYESGTKTRFKLRELKYTLALDTGLLLFIVGMATTESRWWARILWILLGLGVLVEAGMRIHEARTDAAAPCNSQSDGEALKETG